ncbi:hypothetical protein BN1221_03457c [Brenneria goodwinii]|uniref:Uncharacterized protein n=1 Tax=Brenneria goodwinii TaxID=1109412 RepID=A0A0G4JYL7_9GAMM|nr:hypothetical protein BN1221_03457c [Brenneria goodwinii]
MPESRCAVVMTPVAVLPHQSMLPISFKITKQQTQSFEQ